MVEFLKNIIIQHPFISTTITFLLGALGKKAGEDLWDVFKKICYHIFLFFKAWWRVILKEKRTMSSMKKDSRSEWKGKKNG